MRNLLTQAVFDKTFKAGTGSRSPILRQWRRRTSTATEGSYFLDQETFDISLRLSESMIGNALDYLLMGAIVKAEQVQREPIGLELPEKGGA